MAKGKILAYRRDRLGGRLRSMINAMRLAEWTGAELRILWPVGRYASELSTPEEFFDASFVECYFEMDPTIIETTYTEAKHLADFEDFERLIDHLKDGKDVVVENTKDALVLPGEDQDQASLAFIETAKSIEPSHEVSLSLEKLDAALQGQSATALHVRRGDIIQPGRWARTYWPAKYVPDEYYDVMIEAHPETAFVLFSDTAKTIDRFNNVHGIRSASDIMGAESLKESQRDFAELLAISKCSTVFASSDSAFSSAATLLGGASKVSLPEDMPENLKVEAEQRLISRLDLGASEFLSIYDYGQCARRVIDLYKENGNQESAQRIVKTIVDKGFELPFITRSFVNASVLENDDLSVLKALQSEESVRKLRKAHFTTSDLLKHTLRRSMHAAFAYAGLGQKSDAAKIISNMALCQTTICPLDILSQSLRAELSSGKANIPPTTVVPFFHGQTHPRGLASMTELNEHFQSRFLPNQTAFNWQTAFDLDWRTIGVNDRPMPREPQLKQVVSWGKESEDPMLVSLAAFAMLRLGRPTRAKALMAKAERLEAPESTLNQAMMLKRRAQIAEYAGNFATAEKVLYEARQLSNHPALVAYQAYYYTRRKDLPKAREVIRETEQRPFYVSWINYHLFAQRHQVCENREEMRQEILDHFKIEIPVAKPEARVA